MISIKKNKPSTKHICFLAGTLGQGGAERQLFNYLSVLKEMTIPSFVLCMTKGDYWEKRIIDLGVPVIWVGRSGSKIIKLITIINELRKRPVDFIQSLHFHTNIYAFLVAYFLGIKGIGSIRGDVIFEMAGLGIFGKINLFSPRQIVANSKSAINTAIKLGKKEEQLFFLPNVVDVDFFLPGRRKEISNLITIAFVGTLWPPKRVDRIINLARICFENNLNVFFNIFGEGINRRELEELAANQGILNKNIRFFGRISDPHYAYNSSDILILTSDHEGTPNVILEAMACGLPILSTNVGDVKELIDDGINGFLVNIEDEITLFSKLKILCEDSKLREQMGKNNRNKIVNERSINNLKQYFSILYGFELNEINS